ncbi:MAG: histone deacetylase family protein [Xanthomonadales bacterium]|nr:histone deacetylase family protein [Xanthomonadales bacterium]
MKAIYHPAQQRHYPPHFLVNGVFEPNPEKPERVERLLAGARQAGCELRESPDLGRAPIEAVHSVAYLDFLQRAHERWRRIEGAAPAVTPNIHPDCRAVGYPASVVAQAGYHMTDASAPIAEDTWESSCRSAWSAAQAARLVLAGEPSAYALCRPPGHHAFSDMAGGFCYLNNGAIAAQKLRSAHRCVAILDVDLHHGNGTQSIFYRRDDVLTVSIHADPRRFYPFFWGYAEETGEDDGEGYNFNFPLPRGSGDSVFLAALDTAIERIQAYSPGALVLALGLDAFEGDPFGGLSLTTGGFREIARRVAARLALPTVIVQEGGYLCDALGDNLAAFLEGFQHG